MKRYERYDLVRLRDFSDMPRRLPGQIWHPNFKASVGGLAVVDNQGPDGDGDVSIFAVSNPGAADYWPAERLEPADDEALVFSLIHGLGRLTLVDDGQRALVTKADDSVLRIPLSYLRAVGARPSVGQEVVDLTTGWRLTVESVDDAGMVLRNDDHATRVDDWQNYAVIHSEPSSLKIGDRVRALEWPSGTVDSRPFFCLGMDGYKGQEARIVQVSYHGKSARLAFDDGFECWWRTDSLEPAADFMVTEDEGVEIANSRALEALEAPASIGHLTCDTWPRGRPVPHISMPDGVESLTLAGHAFVRRQDPDADRGAKPPCCSAHLPTALVQAIVDARAACPNCGHDRRLCYLPKCRAPVHEPDYTGRRLCARGHDQDER